jgi:predicted lipid-binding transport protein (Tim44 family)
MIRRFAYIAAALLLLGATIAPGDAMARAGSGTSSGSRGTRTYSAPPTTNTAPSTAAPMQRSMTPQTAPSPGSLASPTAPLAQPGFFGRSPFMSGLMGGLLGAGIGGLLFGGGMFHGMNGFAGFLGFLLQIGLVVIVGRLIWGFFASRRPAMAGGPDIMGRSANPGMPMGGGRAPNSIAITADDYHAFEGVLQHVQAAWSAHDLNTMRSIATPEMVSYFAEQMAEQASRGVRNMVGDVKLEQGDLAEAWAEPNREYATVAMRFSMIDVTRDAAGRVVDGSPTERTQATEVWTFLRAPGGSWLLSAIQQTR